MKPNARTLCSIALSLLASSIVGPLAADDAVDAGVRTIRSPAGHAVHLLAVPDAADVAIRVAWRSDWASDEALHSAVPMIGTQVMLSGGTAELSPAETGQRFEDLGVRGSLGNDMEYVYGDLHYPAEHAEPALALAKTLLIAPGLDANWVARTKNRIVRDRQSLQDDESVGLWSTARRAILGESRLETFLSSLDTAPVERVDRDDILRWHASTFLEARPLVTIAGALTDDEAGAAIDALLPPPAGDETPEPLSPSTDFSPRTILLHRPEVETSTLALIGPLPSTRLARDHDDVVDRIALVAFGGNEKGPLFDAVRTQLRASYGFSAGTANLTSDTRFMFIAGEVDTARLEDTRALVIDTWDAFRAAPDGKLSADVAEATGEQFVNLEEDVSLATLVMLDAVMDGRDPSLLIGLADAIEDVDADRVRTRLKVAFPAGEDLLVLGMSPDPEALPGACVITRIEDVSACR